jgi:hypothetical protein
MPNNGISGGKYKVFLEDFGIIKRKLEILEGTDGRNKETR